MPRASKILLLICCFALVFAPQAEAAKKKAGKAARKPVASSAAVNESRYAALIMDPQTGEVLHQANADARRYPASLTKMMTLYLLFEALEKHKTTLGAHLDVSDYAASMPQTNLALRGGDSIPVEVAIKALVVRSANDVSVVVAEALGGDVENFADMMTDKARALGMHHTVFKNPNGLPNSGQYTTARDMAKLGIALKRDFPRYYPYFATRQFSWNGATYYTHNRVMLRYAGTDGIKTGFIGASGFNVVSSVTRGGRPLIGVVMGGASGGWRDNRMIQLLDGGYQTIAERGGARGKVYAENLPTSRGGVAAPSAPRAVKVAAPAELPVAVALTAASPAVPQGDVAEDSDVSPKTPFAYTKAPAHAAADDAREWGIQVGAFSSRELAEQAIARAVGLAQPSLGAAQREIPLPVPGAAPVHRARLTNLSVLQARGACERLVANSMPCFIFKSGQ